MTAFRNGSLKRRAVLVAAAAAIALTAAGSALAQQPRPQPAPADRTTLESIQRAFTSIAETVEPAVVNVTSETTVPVTNNDDSFPWPFSFPDPRGDRNQTPRRATATGSGFIIRPNGVILTNDHVVAGADRVTIRLADGRELRSTKVLRDPTSDVAIVQVDATNLPTVKLGDSDRTRVGQWAIAIGNPFGLDQTLTVGVISALTREFAVPGGMGDEGRFYPDLIQTDASINRGNSGGPLLNINGEVIGINTAIQSPSGGNIGIGFAIPINAAKFVVDQLLTKGTVTRGFLGIGPENVTPQLAETLGVKQGAYVQSVEQGGPADKAGIQVEDVIVEFGGKPVTNALELRRAAASTVPGTKAPVVVVRDKKRQTLTVTVGERTATASTTPEQGAGSAGITVEALTNENRRQYDIDAGVNGVVVARVTANSAAADAGLRAGDVITRVNGVATNTVASFNTQMSKARTGDNVRMVVLRGNMRMSVSFTLD